MIKLIDCKNQIGKMKKLPKQIHNNLIKLSENIDYTPVIVTYNPLIPDIFRIEYAITGKIFTFQ